MEENMTPESAPANNLAAWWETVSFAGKDQFTLSDAGELNLKASGDYKERTVAHLDEGNAAIAFKALQDKFPEVQAKVNELQTEWNSAEDKLKLTGKVERIKEYLKHTNAIGDFHALYTPLVDMSKTIEEHTQVHYAQKLKLVEAAEALADNDSWKETTQKYKDLADEWKHTGQIDKGRSDELWNRMEAAKNKFYERKRAAHEETEKEMLQNLDLKLELVEKAESFAASENWKEVTEQFKEMMEAWKKIGRTMHDKNEELWNRFIQAKNVFYDRKKAHFETIQTEQEANALLKEAIIEQAEALKESTSWNATSQKYAELMEEWKKIGRVPLEKADDMWNRFTAAKEQFFSAKKHHFEHMKVALEDNYAQKMGLLKRAEALQNSRHWREATAEINELMDEWKKIGPVPREHSNTIWEAFIGARKTFFARKDADREKRLQQAERQKSARSQQAAAFLTKLEREIEEEQERLADFKNGLENITPGHKEKELREHLTKLIAQTEHKIQHKQEKLDEVKKQMDQPEAQEPNPQPGLPPADN
jgi:Domain of Unknown Function (DUF349).